MTGVSPSSSTPSTAISSGITTSPEQTTTDPSSRLTSLRASSTTSRTAGSRSSDFHSAPLGTVSLAALDLATTQPKTRIPPGLHREPFGSVSEETADQIKQRPSLEHDLSVDKKFNDKTLVSFQSDLALAAISHVSGDSQTSLDVQTLVRDVTRSIVADIDENGLTPDAQKSLGFLQKQLPGTLQEFKDQPLGSKFNLALHLYFQAEVGYKSDAIESQHADDYRQVLNDQDGARRNVGKWGGESEGIKRTPQTKQLGIGLDENRYDTIFPELRTQPDSHFGGGRIWHVHKHTLGEANISGPSGTAFRALATATHHLANHGGSPDDINVYKSLVITNLVNQGHHSIEEAVKTTQGFGTPIAITDEGKVIFSNLLHPTFVEGNAQLNQVREKYPQFF